MQNVVDVPNRDKKITIGVVEIIISLAGAAMLALLGWISVSVTDMQTNIAVTAVRVEQNNQMLTTLWEDFISRKVAFDGNITKPNVISGYKTAGGEI